MPSAKYRALRCVFARLIPACEVQAEVVADVPEARSAFGGMSRTEVRNAMFAHAYGGGRSILAMDNPTVATISDEISEYAASDISIQTRMMHDSYTQLHSHQQAVIRAEIDRTLTASTPATHSVSYLSLEMPNDEILTRLTTNGVIQSRTAEDSFYDFWRTVGSHGTQTSAT